MKFFAISALIGTFAFNSAFGSITHDTSNYNAKCFRNYDVRLLNLEMLLSGSARAIEQFDKESHALLLADDKTGQNFSELDNISIDKGICFETPVLLSEFLNQEKQDELSSMSKSLNLVFRDVDLLADAQSTAYFGTQFLEKCAGIDEERSSRAAAYVQRPGAESDIVYLKKQHRIWTHDLQEFRLDIVVKEMIHKYMPGTNAESKKINTRTMYQNIKKYHDGIISKATLEYEAKLLGFPATEATENQRLKNVISLLKGINAQQEEEIKRLKTEKDA